MKKIILSGVLLLLCGGCVIYWEDDNAAGAVKEYQRLLTALLRQLQPMMS